MNIFDEVLHRLSSKMRIRTLFKDAHIDDLEKIVNRLGVVLGEKKKLAAEGQAKRIARQEDIEEVKRLLSERGLSLVDLDVNQVSREKKRRNIQKFTFQYKTSVGDSIEWKGSTTGRLPKPFQEYLDRTGMKRLDCVIQE